MKQLIYLLTLLILLNPSMAQKVNKEKIAINYTQLPLTPLPANIKTFNTKTIVKTGGAYRIGDKYVAKIGEVVSTGKEYKGIPEVKFMDKKIDYESKYLTIDGYQKSISNADITITIEFDLLIVNKSESVSEYYNSDKRRCTETKYNYTLPCNLYIVTRDGKEILNQEIANKDYEYTKKVTNCNDKTGDTDFYYELSEYAVISEYAKAQSVIKNNIARVEKSEDFPVFFANGKSFDYTELNKASTDFIGACKTLNAVKEDATAKEIIKSSLTIWIKNISEMDVSNKKARINKVIAYSLKFNCALAYWILKDFENARKIIQDAKIEHKKEASELEILINESEKRFQANIK